MVALVSTDVEGSTELWEWDRDAMDAATKVHDKIMRSKLSAFHGYEINTEGDSFLLAFHEPADAIAWAITMQQVHA
jgi:class 3 adenylate cyclase